ncbi:MAG: hypothetical protein HYY40_07305 [Bacteroidetes bacterium]|nr:hypothetical protein [Bacteroidota bacterium]
MKFPASHIICFIFLLLLLLFIFHPEISAQCSMCRAIAKSGAEDGQNASRGINYAILYLMTLPYILLVIGGGIWYLKRKRIRRNSGSANRS